MSELERLERLKKTELDALAHILKMDPEQRAEELDRVPWKPLSSWVEAIKAEGSLDLSHGDAEAILDRKELKRLKQDLGDQLLRFTADRDPQEGKAAINTLIKDDRKLENIHRAGDAINKLEQAIQDGPRATKDAMVEISIDFRRAPEHDDLKALWDEYKKRLIMGACQPNEGIRVDDDRGYLANWMNSKFGPRGALEPGRTLLIGGGPGAGKTSLGALIAVDALTARCPVLCWQLELSREEMLEHLMGQIPLTTREDKKWWNDPAYQRIPRPLPAAWPNLLMIPQTHIMGSNVEDLIEQANRLAAQTERERKKGEIDHLCNGLILVDYVQLLTFRDQGPWKAQHEVLTTACSRLAKNAADRGMVLVMLSQFTKEEQKRKGSGEGLTGFSGADIGRMAHCALTITRDDMDKETRTIRSVKTRGEFEGEKHEKELKISFRNRALYREGGAAGKEEFSE